MTDMDGGTAFSRVPLSGIQLHSLCLALFCVLSGQSITAINAGPQDTKQKGKTQWVASAGDLLAFSVKAEQELCCGLPLAKSIVCGYAL